MRKIKLSLIHVTPHYHKLVETVARNAYQSWHKLDPDSHKFVKSILKKGHLSVASVGNIIVGIETENIDEYDSILSNLAIFKEINNYIRWTTYHDKNRGTKYHIVLSFNLLTWLEIYNQYDDYHVHEYSLKNNIAALLDNVKDIKWFYDDNIELESVENPYINHPTLLNPVILSEDYTYLKDILTPYELDIHATVTVAFMTDRASGLQTWRHTDMTSGIELSQRYVDRSEAGYRVPVDLDTTDKMLHKLKMMNLLSDYNKMVQYYVEKGFRQGRAKELARNYLPNVETYIMQTRPLRQWKHFFELRDSVHAQKEIQEDTKALKQVFAEKGINF